ncbi:MAG: ribonuclease HII [Candidatus Omnitrophota bacterium]
MHLYVDKHDTRYSILNTQYEIMWSFENQLFVKGIHLIAGVDEAGRGPWAGPVVAAAVILPEKIRFINKIADSKKLTPKMRERAHNEICDHTTVGIGIVSEDLIDRLNILNATLLAMQQAVDNLKTKPQWVLIDGKNAPALNCQFSTIINGDDKSISIACASIVAKVRRDKIMFEYEEKYPGYDFARHKGYGTKRHLEALLKLGPSPIHRKTFAPIKRLLTPD